jgi:anti-sigma factor RsiW
MNMANEMLDILMGKHLDGEITPDEQRLLDQFLATDDAAREEFESFRRLHELTRSAVSEALDGGKPMEEVFEAAWRQSSPARRIRNRLFRWEWALAAAGLAAGLLLGFVIHE